MDIFNDFKDKLDKEHKWPSEYMFKFVAPREKEVMVRELFSGETIQTRHSKAGNYVSFTMKKFMKSSDEVVEIYLRAKEIDGLIVL